MIILHRLEELFLDQGEPSEIIRVYQEALQQDPQNPVLQFYLGKLYYRLEMVDEAFDQLSMIEGPQDHLLDYHKIMANLYLRKQHFEEAIVELKKASASRSVVVPISAPSVSRNPSNGRAVAAVAPSGIHSPPSPGSKPAKVASSAGEPICPSSPTKALLLRLKPCRFPGSVC